MLDASLNRDHIADSLLQMGIDTRPIFYPLHIMPPYKNLPSSSTISSSIAISRSGLSLPSSCSLSFSDIEFIVNSLSSVISQMMYVNA